MNQCQTCKKQNICEKKQELLDLIREHISELIRILSFFEIEETQISLPRGSRKYDIRADILKRLPALRKIYELKYIIGK